MDTDIKKRNLAGVYSIEVSSVVISESLPSFNIDKENWNESCKEETKKKIIYFFVQEVHYI